MATVRPTTPPQPGSTSFDSKSPLTPEHVRQREINRLKAKALQREREKDQSNQIPPSLQRSASSTAGTKRPYSAISEAPSNQRDARNNTPAAAGQKPSERPLDDIKPARNFAKYIEYDFSKMTDTKGGFLTQEDDPHNKTLHADDQETRPANMTLKEWEMQRLLRSLRNQRAGPFEPGISSIKHEKQKTCRECGTLEIDFTWDEHLSCQVCNACKEKYPDKYSLLTKTEAREDYLLTDPELRDEDLLPHLERPNPHKSTWNNMMLFLRYQVEEYAFSPKKWGNPEALDAEFERRETEKKRRKEAKFKSKLQDLKKRTRVEAYKRSRAGGGGTFGDEIGGRGKHVHEWGTGVEDVETGVGVKRCVTCGMEVEELEF